MTSPEPLPPTFVDTRESLRAIACFVLGPAARLRTGHIWLQVDERGIGVPDGAGLPSLAVVGTELVRGDGARCPIRTLRALADFAGVELRADPGVGESLPPFRPDDVLAVHPAATSTLADWYHDGNVVLGGLRQRLGDRAAIGTTCLWPEHFDLALTVDGGPGRQANVGFSGGDTWCAEPYVYVGPWDVAALDRTAAGVIWNAPFGAALGRSALVGPAAAAGFVDAALAAMGLG